MPARELAHEARTTRRVLERAPDDSLEWRPHERSFTLGVLAMHVATLPAAIANLAMQPGIDVKRQIPRPSARSSAELVETMDRSVTEAKRVLAKMGDGRLGAAWRMMGGERELTAMPRWLPRNVMLNHWYRYRRRLTLYLRELDVTVPAIYGANADENPMAR